MFEVIISEVRTGRVLPRQVFDTHEQAVRFADAYLAAWLNPKSRGGRCRKPRTARDIRIEIQSRDLSAIRLLVQASNQQVAAA